jgi:hypothetical protein
MTIETPPEGGTASMGSLKEARDLEAERIRARDEAEISEKDRALAWHRSMREVPEHNRYSYVVDDRPEVDLGPRCSEPDLHRYIQ